MASGLRRARCYLLSTLVVAWVGGPRSRPWAQEVVTCSNNTSSQLEIKSSADTVLLGDSVSCIDGGRVEAIWVGNVTLDAPISIGSGTFLSITGEDALAEVHVGSQIRMFEVSPAGGLELTDLKLSGGKAASGGAIFSSMATVTLNNCVFDGNVATDGDGGAVWAEGGDLTIVGGEFSGNSASGNGGAVLVVDAKVVIQNGTRFEGNKAVEGGGLYCGGAENSTVLATGANASCSLSGAVFERNNASSAIIIDFDLVVSPWVTLYGGGAAAFYRGVVDISDSNFEANYAQLSGGALYGGPDSAMAINGCRFEDNVTPGYGGAMSASSATLGQNTLLANNSATRNGGAVFMWNATGTIELNTILCTNNTAAGYGGCLYVSGGGVVNNGTIMRTSKGKYGGCIYAFGGCDLEINGGEFTECLATFNGAFMYASDGALVTVKEATVTNNVAINRAAVVYCSGDTYDLGGSKVTIEGGTFTDNQAFELGGAFVAWGASTVLTITGGVFSNNTAKYYGGFVFLEEGASLACEGATITDHFAGDQGGAIYAREATWVNSSCDLISNGAPQGAAAYLTNTAKSANFEKHEVKGNVASSGSSVYAVETFVSAKGLNFQSGIDLQEHSPNRAIQLEEGAALVAEDCVFGGWMGDTVIHNANLFSEAGSLVLDSCDFSDNAVTTVIVSPYSDAEIRNAIIDHHTIENAATVNSTRVLVDRASSCAVSNICGPGECVDSVLGVLCECLADGVCLNDGGSLSVSLKTPPPNVTYSPDLVNFELLVSAALDGTTPTIWNLTLEADDLTLLALPYSGVLPPGGNATVIVTGSPVKQDVGGNLVSRFMVTSVGRGSSDFKMGMEVEVESAFYLCQAFEYAMPVDGTDDDISCEQCGAIDGTEGVDCELPGATLTSLPVRKGYWRSNRESLVIHPCIHSEACAGATQIVSSDDYCSDGYERPYCASCQRGYGMGIGGTCHSCDDDRSRWVIFAGALITLLTLLFLVLAVTFLICGLDAVEHVRHSVSRTLSAATGKVLCSKSAPRSTSLPFQTTTSSIKSARADPVTTIDSVFAPAFVRSTRRVEEDAGPRRAITSYAINDVFAAGNDNAGAVPEGREHGPSIENGRGKSESGACCGLGGKIKLWTSRVPLNKLKILVVVWQILTVFPSITGTDFPPAYAQFLSWIDIVNLDVGAILSATCVLPDVSFYQRLMLTTLVPLALAAVLVITYMMAKRRAGIRSDSVLVKETAWSRHMAAGLLMTFLVFTPTSTVAFKTFACDEQAVEGESYLRADYSLLCDTTEHVWYKIYAGIMVVVYPIGISLLYAFILWANRDSLNPRVQAASDMSLARTKKYSANESPKELVELLEKRRENPDLVPSMFLWKDFGPNMYYYEVIECGRRILLTGALIFIAPHTAAQAAMACIFAFASLLGFELLRPHLDPVDSSLYRLGCVVIFLSNFSALLVKVDAAGDGDQALLGGIMITVNILFVLAVLLTSWFGTQPLVDDGGESSFDVAKTMLTYERHTASRQRLTRAERTRSES